MLLPFIPFHPGPTPHPWPTSIHRLSSYPLVVRISSLAFPFPSLFLTSCCLFSNVNLNYGLTIAILIAFWLFSSSFVSFLVPYHLMIFCSGMLWFLSLSHGCYRFLLCGYHEAYIKHPELEFLITWMIVKWMKGLVERGYLVSRLNSQKAISVRISLAIKTSRKQNYLRIPRTVFIAHSHTPNQLLVTLAARLGEKGCPDHLKMRTDSNSRKI